jgi:hypothetical protein
VGFYEWRTVVGLQFLVSIPAPAAWFSLFPLVSWFASRSRNQSASPGESCLALFSSLRLRSSVLAFGALLPNRFILCASCGSPPGFCRQFFFPAKSRSYSRAADLGQALVFDDFVPRFHLALKISSSRFYLPHRQSFAFPAAGRALRFLPPFPFRRCPDFTCRRLVSDLKVRTFVASGQICSCLRGRVW